jgi:hypothetical protein
VTSFARIYLLNKIAKRIKSRYKAVSFALSSLALFFLQEYKLTVSSKCSGGEHDSTGLRAKQKLITPLLRCASPETATLYGELFETTQQNKKGSHRLPFLHFGVD